MGVPKWTFSCRLPGLWPHSTLAKTVVTAASTLLGKSSSRSLRKTSPPNRVSPNALRLQVSARELQYTQPLPHSSDAACNQPAAAFSKKTAPSQTLVISVTSKVVKNVIYPNIFFFVSGLYDLSTERSELLKSLTGSVLRLI